MAKIINEKIKCACCCKESEQTLLLSSSIFGGRDLDTRPSGFGRENLRYEIQECPFCHYCNIRIDDTEGVFEKIGDEQLVLAHDRSIPDTARRFLLSAMRWSDIGDLYLAGESYLKAAWVFDDEGDGCNAKLAREKAALHFEKFIDVSGDGDTAIMLVDVYRRSAAFDKALALLDEIGDAEDDFLNAILNYERALAIAKDAACHTIGEATNG